MREGGECMNIVSTLKCVDQKTFSTHQSISRQSSIALTQIRSTDILR